MRNLGLINPSVTSTAANGRGAGALAGHADGGSVVEYVYVHGGRIASAGGGSGSTAWVGGLIGDAHGTVRASYAGAAIAATQTESVRMGGLVGGLDGAVIESFAYGPVLSTAAQNSPRRPDRQRHRRRPGHQQLLRPDHRPANRLHRPLVPLLQRHGRRQNHRGTPNPHRLRRQHLPDLEPGSGQRPQHRRPGLGFRRPRPVPGPMVRAPHRPRLPAPRRPPPGPTPPRHPLQPGRRPPRNLRKPPPRNNGNLQRPIQRRRHPGNQRHNLQPGQLPRPGNPPPSPMERPILHQLRVAGHRYAAV